MTSLILEIYAALAVGLKSKVMNGAVEWPQGPYLDFDEHWGAINGATSLYMKPPEIVETCLDNKNLSHRIHCWPGWENCRLWFNWSSRLNATIYTVVSSGVIQISRHETLSFYLSMLMCHVRFCSNHLKENLSQKGSCRPNSLTLNYVWLILSKLPRPQLSLQIVVRRG